MTHLFDELHSGDPDPAEARIDSGDGLDSSRACSFLEGVDTTGDPCPHEATDTREISGIEMAACVFHAKSGGFLNHAAHSRYGRELIAQRNREAVESAKRLGIEPGTEGHHSYPRQCSKCGCLLFTGNSNGLCSECAPLPCSNCSEPIEITDRGVWVHIDDKAIACDVDEEGSPDAEPPCSCEHGETDPFCRRHGLEDVVSGAYDMNPEVAKRVHRALGSSISRDDS